MEVESAFSRLSAGTEEALSLSFLLLHLILLLFIDLTSALGRVSFHVALSLCSGLSRSGGKEV